MCVYYSSVSISISGYDITYWKLEGMSPGVLYIQSLLSEHYEKADALEEYCRKEGLSFIRFCLSGTGESEGCLPQSTMTDWLGDALTIVRQVATGPQILVGAGLGGWLMFLVAMREPESVHSLVGMSTSPDFLQLLWKGMTEAEKREAKKKGHYEFFKEGMEAPLSVSLELIQDSSRYTILDMPGLEIISSPVRLLHGSNDAIVAPSVSMGLVQRLSAPTTFNVVPGGDHFLSRSEDLKLMVETVDQCVHPVAYDNAQDSEDET